MSANDPLMKHRNRARMTPKPGFSPDPGRSLEATYLLSMRCPVFRRHDSYPGFRTELESLADWCVLKRKENLTSQQLGQGVRRRRVIQTIGCPNSSCLPRELISTDFQSDDRFGLVVCQIRVIIGWTLRGSCCPAQARGLTSVVTVSVSARERASVRSRLCLRGGSIASESKPRIAIVDDDALIVESFADEFSEEFLIAGFTSPIKALEASRLQQMEVIIADYRMPELDGITFLRNVRQIRPNLTRILFTAYADLACLSRAINEAEIFHYIGKDSLGRPGKHPEMANIILRAVDLTSLREERDDLLRRLTEQAESLREENERLNHQRPRQLETKSFLDMKGDSPGLQEVIRRGREAARYDFPVLIYGETGTGKEILSRAIHFEGARKSHSFVAINCGATQKDLITSELMGYTKGAFTGASDNKRGVLEAADKGTVFLDEIGDLPLDSQAHLLRFLENNEVRPLGSAVAKQVDVRIIAATHRNLEKEVKAGRFRQDLYYRLNSGLELTLPPLRDRLEDLPSLITHILRNEDKRYATFEITPEALELLGRHQFPGNVRELTGILRKAVTEAVLSGENMLLPSHFRMFSSICDTLPGTNHWKSVANHAKIEDIKRALTEHKTITAAAAQLGLTREGLSRLMGSLGIKNSQEK